MTDQWFEVGELQRLYLRFSDQYQLLDMFSEMMLNGETSYYRRLERMEPDGTTRLEFVAVDTSELGEYAAIHLPWVNRADLTNWHIAFVKWLRAQKVPDDVDIVGVTFRAREAMLPIINHAGDRMNELQAAVLQGTSTQPAAGTVSPQQAEAPVAPKQMLIGWDAILKAIGVEKGNERIIKDFNRTHNGPIITRQGGNPVVDINKLVLWWNAVVEQLENKADADKQTRQSVSALAEVNYGRTGSAVPEIGGGVKKRGK